MNVALVGVTQLTPEFFENGGFARSKMHQRDWQDLDQPSDLLAEAAGRVCYNSFHLPNPKTASNEGYLNNIKYQMHYTVLEHASFTFYLENVSRALLAELTRHRHHSFSVRSQRYCDESNSDHIMAPVLLKHKDNLQVRMLMNRIDDLHQQARTLYIETQNVLRDLGETNRKVQNDAARYVLPEGTATELYVTSNGNGWIQFLAKRYNDSAAEEIRTLAGKMQEQLKKSSPNIFQ